MTSSLFNLPSLHHVAILNKKWKALHNILSGKKTIESRWYNAKVAPWGRIQAGDTVFLKNAGEPITAKTIVEDVLSFELTPSKVMDILKQYASKICIQDLQLSYEAVKNKKYGMLIFLKDPKVIDPFDIDKTGFGNMSAWITVTDIEKIRRSSLRL